MASWGGFNHPRMLLVLRTKPWAPRRWLPNPDCRWAALRAPSTTSWNHRLHRLC